jgi:hypothetical protein
MSRPPPRWGCWRWSPGRTSPHAVVEFGHLVEHPAEVTPIRFCHRTILPPAVPDAPVRAPNIAACGLPTSWLASAHAVDILDIHIGRPWYPGSAG